MDSPVLLSTPPPCRAAASRDAERCAPRASPVTGEGQRHSLGRSLSCAPDTRAHPAAPPVRARLRQRGRAWPPRRLAVGEARCHGRGRRSGPPPMRGPAAHAFHFCIPPCPGGVSARPQFRHRAEPLSGIARNVSASEPPSGAVEVTSAASRTHQHIPPGKRRGGPRRARPSTLPAGGHRASGLAAPFCGCAGAAHPPAVSPQPAVASEQPPPGWQAERAPAGRREASVPALPPILTRRVTLVLGIRVTIARGALLLQGAERSAAAEGDIAPPSGAVVVDAAGQFVTPRLIDSRSTSGSTRRQAQRPTWTAANGSEREPDDGTGDAAGSVRRRLLVKDPGIERAVAGDVTTIQVLPRSGNLIRGCAVTIERRRALCPLSCLLPRVSSLVSPPSWLLPPRSSPDARHRGGRGDEGGLRGEPEARLRRGQAGTDGARANLALGRAASLETGKLQTDWAR
ncbi:uncharacterized protein SOCE26_087470 [Sorangium cellulosum]|uniref:Uncharacterized protein n=1 Tax=Sorangium cellulosum TaxID=56 RepID=A0A2L0F6N9_SORCE|nr:uncharacterized protein SOCE26_087470 [Sorangium cellulosum]